VWAAVICAWRTLGSDRVIVRSSAIGEDSATASFAGCLDSIPDIVTDGVNGVITDPYDEGALADVLVRLAGEDALCRKMGEAARERAEGYSVEKFTDNIWSLYNRIVRIAA